MENKSEYEEVLSVEDQKKLIQALLKDALKENKSGEHTSVGYATAQARELLVKFMMDV